MPANKKLKLTPLDDRGMKNYEGIALVLRCWMFQCLTDLYGPIPFREASNAALKDIGKPKYEKQENAYKGILDDLEQANQLLGSSSNRRRSVS
ncbi:MAG TPA: SusD/RagB family nutrient-binding outer membrane lipoprotein [Chitinophagaceae bacterium]|nr:SusD/RagB family nutrient-binding outer membrane lipoprotein [Chitinophagaceae bacterium]